MRTLPLPRDPRKFAIRVARLSRGGWSRFWEGARFSGPTMHAVVQARWTPQQILRAMRTRCGRALKLTACDISPGKKVSPMGREGPERRLVAPLNACPLLPRMQERSSLSVYLSFMGASLRNRGQSSARHGITSPQPTRRYTFRAPRFGTGR